MHHGNFAFWMDDALPFRPAPSYDMLPMLWSPGPQGEIIERLGKTFEPRAELAGIYHKFKLDPTFPAAVEREVEAKEERNVVDDPDVVDEPGGVPPAMRALFARY